MGGIHWRKRLQVPCHAMLSTHLSRVHVQCFFLRSDPGGETFNSPTACPRYMLKAGEVRKTKFRKGHGKAGAC